MIIAISSTGPSLNDQIDARFGRCEYFIIVDSETMAHESIPNENVSATSGAGISAAQLMVDKGVDIVLTGNVGPKAANVFDAGGIRVVTGMGGTVGDAAKQYADGRDVAPPATPGQMPATPKPGVPGQGLGMGGGRGMGGCRQNGGSGRGMGRGRGMRR